MARVGIRVGMCDLELNLFALKLEKVSTMYFFLRLIFKELFLFFFSTTYCVYYFIFFSHNVEMFKFLSGGVVIYAFFGTNPLITDANVALDAYIAAYVTRRTALSASLHTTSGRMRSFLHRGPHRGRMKRFFCHHRTPYAINITRYI